MARSRRSDVTRGRAVPPSEPSDSSVVQGVRISHPDRLIYPDLSITKLDVARYYDAIGPWILPHVVGRPLTLVHCPGGIGSPCAYLKHSKLWGPQVIRRVRIRDKTKIGEYMVVDDLRALIGLAQMGVVEIHTWNAIEADVERPDRIVWDLDPGPEIEWRQVVAAARTLRDVLNVLGLESWVKTTGGAGLHVVAPLTPQRDWSECLAFSRAVADALVRTNPLFTTRFVRRGRESQILIDYLRNNRTNTSVAAFSLRARAGAPVSVPLRWEQLTARLRHATFSVTSVPRRFAHDRDPWSAYWDCRQRISNQALRAVSQL